MQKKIEIDGKVVPLVSSAASPIIYRNAFKRDFFDDFGIVMEMALDSTKKKKADRAADAIKMFSGGRVSLLINFVWVYARNADQNLPDLDTWLEQYDEFPIFDFIEDVIDLMQQSLTTKKD
jgi:hypothetical protein